jgi:hypothetical protein
VNPARQAVWAAFAAGLLLGGVAGAVFAGKRASHSWKKSPDSERALRRLSSRLKLDEGQRAAVKSVLDARRDKVKTLQKETMDKMEALRVSARAEIVPLLRPDQQSRYAEMNARWEKRHSKLREELNK